MGSWGWSGGLRGRVWLLGVVSAAMAVLPAGPAAAMPSPSESFLGMGTTLEGCIFPVPAGGQTAGCTSAGAPASPIGAAGLSDYVEATNSGYAVFSKSGALIQSPRFLKTLWSGYTGANSGNSCSTSTDGLPVVRYDQLADRWVIMQSSLPNGGSNSSPSFECVAVSKTSDPTGGWWRYDYQYNYAANEFPTLGVWPDAYYATYDMFTSTAFAGAHVCAWNRAAMLSGPDANSSAETQQCFQKSSTVFGMVPANVDGPIPPPEGSPEELILLSANSLTLYRFHVDWSTPANSTLTGGVAQTVNSFTDACNQGYCIPQPSPGNQLASVSSAAMDRLVYRNFGDHQSLIVNHSITSGSSVGVRWYEIRDPGGTPTVYQQGTVAPDSAYRWMGSMTEDQAQDMVLGYSESSALIKPSVAWSGRTAGDTLGTMGQAESTVHAGGGVETGIYLGSTAQSWGWSSDMTMDPSDDCTFWYTNAFYPSNGVLNWDTWIASVKFPGCAANDFSLASSPASVSQASSGLSGIDTTLTNGSAETVSLHAQDLPLGVTASFSPSSVTAGGSSTLTFTATAGAPTGTYTVGIIGTAASAAHYATVTLTVTAPASADFSIAASPSSVSASQGSSSTTTIQTATTAGSSQSMALSANGLPAGATASFDRASIISGQSATLTLAAGTATAPGIYPVTVTGAESPSAATHSTTVNFTVVAPATGGTGGTGGTGTGGTGGTGTGGTGTGGTGGGGGGTQPTPPVVSSFRESHKVWVPGSALARISRKRKHPVGSVFSFILNEAAGIQLQFLRALPGRMAGSRCAAPTRRSRHGRRCTRLMAAGTLSLAGHSGADNVAFQGRISSTTKLGPGSYVVALVATNAAGQKSAVQTLRFQVVTR